MDDETVTLFLCGDVMTGRGIDQVFSRSVPSRLHEPYVKSARRYVELAERAHGPVPAPVEPSYVWGDALELLADRAPDARIVNLETAVTTSDDAWTGKGIHYRMHPANVACLRAADIDVCVLANNHVLDWGYPGLGETLETLRGAGIRTAGAGRGAGEARAPAVVDLPLTDGMAGNGAGEEGAGGEAGAEPTAGSGATDRAAGGGRDRGAGRVLVFAFGHGSAGVPLSWAPTEEGPGMSRLPDLSEETAARVAREVGRARADGDRVVVSIHWGPNWGYAVPQEQQSFARQLVDEADVDAIHGHSSHHPKGIEVYRGRPILYGCGDFLNDYEGIGGHEAYRPELVLMYLVTLDTVEGGLVRLEMVPLELRRFRLRRADEEDVDWLCARMDRECGKLGAGVERTEDGTLELVAGDSSDPA